MSNAVYTEANAAAPIWPPSDQVQGVSSAYVNETGLSESFSSEAQLAGRLKELGIHEEDTVRVKASAVRPSAFAPNSGFSVNAVLGAAAAERFLGAGPACRVIFLKD
ncbi:hypothetical protein [Deinococcus hohokamensis]|uniref:Uncharacterized protein n=1 Tax=Deinococcus hohokamensis TaxID=309883 RepID=A0ABV9IC22_9DEIO